MEVVIKRDLEIDNAECQCVNVSKYRMGKRDYACKISHYTTLLLILLSILLTPKPLLLTDPNFTLLGPAGSGAVTADPPALPAFKFLSTSPPGNEV